LKKGRGYGRRLSRRQGIWQYSHYMFEGTKLVVNKKCSSCTRSGGRVVCKKPEVLDGQKASLRASGSGWTAAAKIRKVFPNEKSMISAGYNFEKKRDYNVYTRGKYIPKTQYFGSIPILAVCSLAPYQMQASCRLGFGPCSTAPIRSTWQKEIGSRGYTGSSQIWSKHKGTGHIKAVPTKLTCPWRSGAGQEKGTNLEEYMSSDMLPQLTMGNSGVTDSGSLLSPQQKLAKLKMCQRCATEQKKFTVSETAACLDEKCNDELRPGVQGKWKSCQTARRSIKETLFRVQNNITQVHRKIETLAVTLEANINRLSTNASSSVPIQYKLPDQTIKALKDQQAIEAQGANGSATNLGKQLTDLKEKHKALVADLAVAMRKYPTSSHKCDGVCHKSCRGCVGPERYHCKDVTGHGACGPPSSLSNERSGLLMMDPYLKTGICIPFPKTTKDRESNCKEMQSPTSISEVHSNLAISKVCTVTVTNEDTGGKVSCELTKLVLCKCDESTRVNKRAKCLGWKCLVSKKSLTEDSSCERVIVGM